MAKDKDELPLRIDTSHLSDDFADKVAQMVQEHLQNPQEEVDVPPWLTISPSKENSISPAIQKTGVLDIHNTQASNEEIRSDMGNEIQLQPGEAVPLFNDAFIRRTDLSIQIKDSLKQVIIEAAETTNTSSSAVIESSLRNTFPNSWESDLAKQFHEFNMPSEVLSVTRESYSKGAGDAYSEIEFSLPDKLLDYLVDNINDRASFISFDEAIEQALEHDFHDAKLHTHTSDQKSHFDHN